MEDRPARDSKLTCKESYWQLDSNMVRKYFVPTSAQLLNASQKSIFRRFVRVQPEHLQFATNDGEYLNYIDIKRPQSGTKRKKTLVLMHGFGSGLGMFFANYDALASKFDRVIAVDWLGMGGSSRPSCSNSPRMPIFGNWFSFQTMDPTKATNFFIDNFEEFREKNDISDFVLAGHSLGGYLCTRYAMKYPNAGINSLVLISPAGLADLPPSDTHVPKKELSAGIRLLDGMWNSNFTPQQIVRALGPKGPDTVRNAVKRRFGSDRWSAEDTNLIADYLYHISAGKASGEYAMNSLLKPVISQAVDREAKTPSLGTRRTTGVYAREPVSPILFKESFRDGSRPPPVLIVYGDHDWLRFPSVDKYVEDMNNLGVDATVVTIPQAGHHLYLDNAPMFHEELFSWLDKKC